MTSAYLDTSGYGGIQPGDVSALQEAMARTGIAVLLSITVVEELLGPWETNRSAAVRRLQVVRDLAGFDRMLKPANMLLEDAIRAYAEGSEPPSPMLGAEPKNVLASAFERIAATGDGLSGDVSAIIADVRATKNQFQQSMTVALERARADIERAGPFSRAERRAFTFEAYWTKAAASWAEAFANRVGLGEKCRARGLDGLLQVRAVRLAVGAALSLVYSQVRGEFQPDRNDGYDMWHAIQASAAGVFVTRDDIMARRLARVPVAGFRVVRSLRELLPDPAPAQSH